MDRDTEVKMLAMHYTHAKFEQELKDNPDMIFEKSELLPPSLRGPERFLTLYSDAVEYFANFETMDCDDYTKEIDD
ncbi:MAG: hypothetical protein RSF70_09840 [Ruthenibacterium sp.]